jgi:hypothetical protein
VARWIPVAVGFYVLLGGIAWVWSALGGESVVYASPAAASRGVRPFTDGLSGALAGVALVVASRGLASRSGAGRELATRLAEAVGPLTGRQALALALVSGLGEELFFRGALQPRVGLVAASLLFGLAHLVPAWPLVLWSLFAAGAGLVFGALFAATGNLLAPCLAHALVNALNLRWLAVSRDGTGPTCRPRSGGAGARAGTCPWR